ncbi:MAG: hypothetical protein U0U66_00670 [Cytophagaceae bacterium]
MDRLGVISFQALDDSDVFLAQDVFMDGYDGTDSISYNIPEPFNIEQFSIYNGKVPSMIPVTVDGDTSVIYGWFKGDFYPYAYTIRVYVEYETDEES